MVSSRVAAAAMQRGRVISKVRNFLLMTFISYSLQIMEQILKNAKRPSDLKSRTLEFSLISLFQQEQFASMSKWGLSIVKWKPFFRRRVDLGRLWRQHAVWIQVSYIVITTIEISKRNYQQLISDLLKPWFKTCLELDFSDLLKTSSTSASAKQRRRRPVLRDPEGEQEISFHLRPVQWQNQISLFLLPIFLFLVLEREREIGFCLRTVANIIDKKYKQKYKQTRTKRQERRVVDKLAFVFCVAKVMIALWSLAYMTQNLSLFYEIFNVMKNGFPLTKTLKSWDKTKIAFEWISDLKIARYCSYDTMGTLATIFVQLLCYVVVQSSLLTPTMCVSKGNINAQVTEWCNSERCNDYCPIVLLAQRAW